ncbi:MAG: phosphotransferase [Anaerolineae bacterium]|nr:phosphotransferase [Anaerolineae bacterium]
MSESLLQYAAQCYDLPSAPFTPLEGGHFSHVYQYSKAGRDYVLRITPPNDDIDLQAMQSILEWVHYLREHGAPVAGPVASNRGKLIESCEEAGKTFLLTAFEKAPGVRGETLSFEQWDLALFRELGRVVGKLHAIAKTCAPATAALTRPQWTETTNCFHWPQPLDPSQVQVQAQRARLHAHIAALPKDPEGFGLIHADIHFANIFVVPETTQMTVFDFDDCVYGWYAMDVAMGLFDILVLYPGEDKVAFAGRFLNAYLEGYRRETPFGDFWVRQLPYFLKLLETEIYVMLHRDYTPEDDDPWVSRFMPGRRARLEAGLPYVDLDFTSGW